MMPLLSTQSSELGSTWTLNRRAQARQSVAILDLTRQVRNLTVIITLLTIINAALVAVTIAR
jgi:hypothetical protein